jgi:hypothetical protein
LSSTIRESHLEKDHYGWVGEYQLEWFKKRLETYRKVRMAADRGGTT